MGTKTKKENKTMLDHTSVRPSTDLPFTLNGKTAHGKTTLDRNLKPMPSVVAPKRSAEDEPTIEMTAAELQELLRKTGLPDIAPQR